MAAKRNPKQLDYSKAKISELEAAIKQGKKLKPVEKNYKTKKEYNEALKKFNKQMSAMEKALKDKKKSKEWATTRGNRTNTVFVQPVKDKTKNIIPYIIKDETSINSIKDIESVGPTATEHQVKFKNPHATEDTHFKDYNISKHGKNVRTWSSTRTSMKPRDTSSFATGANDYAIDPKYGYTRNELVERYTGLTSETELAKGKTLSDMMKDVHTALMMPNTIKTSNQRFQDYINYYNRFKVPDFNIPLQKGFAHVFFVRPSCNILTHNHDLVQGLQNNELFKYAYNQLPDLLGELCPGMRSYNTDNDFMMSLSNFSSSFSLSGEYINTDTYGKTYTGYKVTYGKHNIESKTAGTIEVTLNDTKTLKVYQLIRLWVEYINGVYRGTLSPTKEDIFKKILDYTGSIYYIITGEDGETILFWSKYYGVFPSTIPSEQYSWGEGNIIQAPQLSVTFNFSFKEDFNPYSLLEFNYNARIEDKGDNDNIVTIPTYDENLGSSSFKWGKKPFIELVRNEHDSNYIYKLRFTGK